MLSLKFEIVSKKFKNQRTRIYKKTKRQFCGFKFCLQTAFSKPKLPEESFFMNFAHFAGWIRVVSLFCLFGIFVACSTVQSRTGLNLNDGNRATNLDVPIRVSTAIAVSREAPSYIQATGTLTADETSDVAPKVAGQIVSTPVNVGAFVRQGDVIARIDGKNARLKVQELQASVRQAQAAVTQAQARLGLDATGNFQASAIPEVRAANAAYEQAQANLRQAQANESRYRDLVTTGDTSMQNYETYRTQRDTAQSQANAARQQLEAAINAAKQNNQAVKSAQAAVETIKAQLATAQQAVADTIVRAPYSGYISSRPAAIGESVTTTSTIVQILRTNPLKLQLQVGEKDVPFIQVGMGVSLKVEAFQDRNFAGVVSAINPQVDVNSRSAVVEALVENSDNKLRSGMFAVARINRRGGVSAVYVPREAVLSDQNTQSYRAFVIADNVAKLRIVQIGTEENGEIQIQSGINVGETVAVSNLDKLYEGARVQ
jgi:multidrug efflux pump subunit AcrA (membrane-fusion protein)